MTDITQDFEPSGKIEVIRAPKRLGAGESDDFKQVLRDTVDRGVFRLVIDLSGTETMDSSGLGALVSRIAVTRANQGDVRLASVNPLISELLKITHLDQVFSCHDSVDEACCSF